MLCFNTIRTIPSIVVWTGLNGIISVLYGWIIGCVGKSSAKFNSNFDITFKTICVFVKDTCYLRVNHDNNRTQPPRRAQDPAPTASPGPAPTGISGPDPHGDSAAAVKKAFYLNRVVTAWRASDNDANVLEKRLSSHGGR